MSTLVALILLASLLSVNSATPEQHATSILESPGNLGKTSIGDFQPVNWKPQKDKYLVVFCAFGRVSNQVACLRKSLNLAATLNRTLLIPPTAILMFRGIVKENWPLDLVVDWNRMVQCLKPSYGPETIMTYDQYFARHNVKKVVIEKIYCAAPGNGATCAHPRCIEAVSGSLGPLIQFPPLDQYPKWLEFSPLPVDREATRSEILNYLGGRTDRLLCVGEMFPMRMNLKLTNYYFSRPLPSCNNLWRPHKDIGAFVDGVVSNMFETTNYAAMHLRRGDFYLESVQAKEKGEVTNPYFHYSSISEVAKKVAQYLTQANIKSLYIATDASRIEFQLFKNVLRGSSPVTQVLSLKDIRRDPGWLAKQRWAQGTLTFANSSVTGIPWALVEKGICVRAGLFLGTRVSTFSKDILGMRCEESHRQGWDSTSLLCATKGCEPYYC